MDRQRIQAALAKAPRWIVEKSTYIPGKSVSELARELGLKEGTQISKLGSNENPLGPSPKALKAITHELTELHCYPDASATALKEKIALHCNVSGENILLGTGGENILDVVCRGLVAPGEQVLLCKHSFPQFANIASLAGASILWAEVSSGLRPNLSSLLAHLHDGVRLVILGHPDNPSGQFLAPEDLLRLYDALPEGTSLLVDEAYFGIITDPQYKSLLHPDLKAAVASRPIVVLRTFSKAHGLAGLRVAYAVMPREFVEHFDKVRLAFNVSSLAQAGAFAALDDEAHLARTLEVVREEKAYAIQACRDLGLRVLEGAANFFLVSIADLPSLESYQALLKQRVIVRPIRDPELFGMLRISVGTHAQMEHLIDALRTIVSSTT